MLGLRHDRLVPKVNCGLASGLSWWPMDFFLSFYFVVITDSIN